MILQTCPRCGKEMTYTELCHHWPCNGAKPEKPRRRKPKVISTVEREVTDLVVFVLPWYNMGWNAIRRTYDAAAAKTLALAQLAAYEAAEGTLGRIQGMAAIEIYIGYPPGHRLKDYVNRVGYEKVMADVAVVAGILKDDTKELLAPATLHEVPAPGGAGFILVKLWRR